MRLPAASSVLFALVPQSPAPAPDSQGRPAPADLESPARESEYFRLQRELASWRAQHGESWKLEFERETGWASFVYGGARALGWVPRDDAEYFAAARSVLEETRGLHGLDPATLVEESVTLLPLSLAGSNDKLSVQLRQELGGVRVAGGYANVLFDLEGRALSVDVTALPELHADFDVAPAVTADEALAAAIDRFAADTGLPATRIVVPELVIAQAKPVKLRMPLLVWQVEVHYAEPDFAPQGFAYRFDAKSGAFVERAAAVHEDVSGQVKSRATPGTFPDSSSNPETLQNMPYIRVTSAQGNATADANGNFTIAGASAPLSVSVQYFGTYCNSNNVAGSDYSLTTSLSSSSGNVITMNPSSSTLVTSEANAFLWINLMRDWTRAINPSDATSDFLAVSNANLSSTCNAFYDGVSVNFYQSGGGCANTAYSSVVLHEMGHWLNDRYSSFNGSDGFGEGNADNFSTYILDDPIVGHDFCGTNCNVRDANNNRQFCGDCCGGCYGQVHADGEVLMGAMWKVRTRLKNAHGTSPGGQIANVLLNSWMNAYNDTQIKTIVRTHWLVLDDNDGNIDNGTPNFVHIDGGFVQQGFPAYQIQSVSFSSVTDLPDVTNDAGPYVVDASIFANSNPPITSATLRWRANGGSYANVAMSNVAGTTWRGNIPSVASGTKVDYYLTANDSGAHTGTYPAGAPASFLGFKVGTLTIFYQEGFESGTNGWTHGQIATQDDWQLSSAQGGAGSNGESGDPTTAYAGQNMWGNDLGFGSFNGAYTDNVHNWLRSPNVNLAGKFGTSLRLRRWLTVEAGVYDQARIKINGNEVWVNPFGADLIDTSWTELDVDISPFADNNAAVQIEFSMQSDGGVTFGGWNIDDVRIYSLSSACTSPTATTPANATVCPGSPANFSTTASGSAPFTYQWEKNNAAIPGATASSYSIASAAAGDAGNYTCVVTNACGSFETGAGVLALNVATSATTPANQTVCPGGNASFNTTASGTGPFTYQWEKNGVPIGGATSSTYTKTNVQSSDAGTYSVVVTGACNSVEPSASLTVSTATTASTPASATVCPGGAATFSTTAGGTGPFTYQWEKNGAPIGGATSSSFTVNNAQSGDAGTYSVVVTGACNSVEPSATLTVNAATTATTPSSQTLCAGGATSFSTTAGGTGPFTYQWKKNGSAIPGATASSYSIPSAQPSDSGTYSVLVTGACNFVEPSASLLVNAATGATTPASQTVCAGAPASFSTTASGTGPFTYQWKQNGTAIPGATSSSFSIASAQASDAGTYSVLVTGACGSIEPSATLAVNLATTATTPTGASVCVGDAVAFSTTAGGTGPFTYQWKKAGVAIPGATSASFSIASAQASDAGSYSVLVTGACGSIEPSATLVVDGVVATYCTAKLTSTGTLPQIGSTGTPSVTTHDFVVTLSDALPNKFGLVFWGSDPFNAPFNGGILCVQPPLTRELVVQTDANGFATTAIDVDASMIGITRRFQWWFRDQNDPFTIGLSNALSASFCD